MKCIKELFSEIDRVESEVFFVYEFVAYSPPFENFWQAVDWMIADGSEDLYEIFRSADRFYCGLEVKEAEE